MSPYNNHMVGAVIAAALDAKPRGFARELAETMGVTPASVSRWRKGKSLPDMSRWEDLEKALGLGRGRLSAEAGLDEVAGTPLGEDLANIDAKLVEAVTEIRNDYGKLAQTVADLVQRVERLEKGRRPRS